jgi:hypothetical protein
MTWNCANYQSRDDQSMRSKGLRIVGWVIVGVFFAALIALVVGFAVQWLWNWLMPDLFNLKAITYWQAVGLVILGKLLIGGFGHHDSHHYKKKYYSNSHHWQKYGKVWKERGKEAADVLIDGAGKESTRETD